MTFYELLDFCNIFKKYYFVAKFTTHFVRFILSVSMYLPVLAGKLIFFYTDIDIFFNIVVYCSNGSITQPQLSCHT